MKQQPNTKKKKNSDKQDIPMFNDLVEFYAHINARPPLSRDFDVREINPEVIRSYDFETKPFRHNFFCIGLYLEGNVTLNAGFWRTKLDKPALYFKTPYQILSWSKPDKWTKEYFIVFTEQFVLKYKPLSDLIFDLPFLKMGKSIPFELEEGEVEVVTDIYKKIIKEYRSPEKDRFQFIYSYTMILLLTVRRLFDKYVEKDAAISLAIKGEDNTLIDKFQSLVKQHIAGVATDDKIHTVKYYAKLLSTHPNHLNALSKRRAGTTALSLIHQQILIEARSLLGQTSLPIKDISFRLGFNEPPHFNNFFKRHMRCTPADFRKTKTI